MCTLQIFSFALRVEWLLVKLSDLGSDLCLDCLLGWQEAELPSWGPYGQSLHHHWDHANDEHWLELGLLGASQTYTLLRLDQSSMYLNLRRPTWASKSVRSYRRFVLHSFAKLHLPKNKMSEFQWLKPSPSFCCNWRKSEGLKDLLNHHPTTH